MRKLLSAAAVVAALMTSVSANAALLTKSFHLDASDFSLSGLPDPVSLDFTITIDNSQYYTNDAGAITVGSSNLGSNFSALKVGYTFDSDTLFVDSVYAGPNGFYLSPYGDYAFGFVIDHFSTALNPVAVGMSGPSGFSFSRIATLVETSDVPEPASWAMMIGGFGLVGGAMRRKRVSVAFG